MSARHHALLSFPSVVLISLGFWLLSIISHQSGFDLWVTSHLYAGPGASEAFPLRHNFWLDNVLHEGGRAFSKSLFFALTVAFALSFWWRQIKPFRWQLLFVIVATVLATSSVAAMKHSNAIACPYSLKAFGGSVDWVNYWQLLSTELPVGKCYPAGHASSGYAWLAVGFIAHDRRQPLWWFLLPGILMGLTFGIAQQLRGVHFLSHDLATIACCWFISGTTFHAIRRIVPLLASSSVRSLETSEQLQ